MKKLLKVLFSLLLLGTLTLGVLITFDFIEADKLFTSFQTKISSLQSQLEASGLSTSHFADHVPPTGEGHLLEGELPEDRLSHTEVIYNFPIELYPYRSFLAPAEQAAYDQIYSNAMALYNQIPLHTAIAISSVSDVMSALFYDHPELFWLNTAYQYVYNSLNEVVAITLQFNETAENIEHHRNLFDSIVNQIVVEANQLSTPVEKERFVHDYILDNVTYNLDAKLNQSAYSALVYGETVCAGYARAFQHIMLQLGIPCYYCAGYAGEAHAWNMIKLGGEFYHVDVAWNDPIGNTPGRYFYNYFNLTDSEISKDHTRGDFSLKLPACNSTTYNFENAFGSLEVASEPESSTTDFFYNTLKSPEEMGYSRNSAISSLDDYYRYCEDWLVEQGTGNHIFTVLIATTSLTNTILQQTEAGNALSQYVDGAARRLELLGYSTSISLEATSLTDDYWLLTHHLNLIAQESEISETLPLMPIETSTEDFIADNNDETADFQVESDSTPIEPTVPAVAPIPDEMFDFEDLTEELSTEQGL